MLMGKINKLIKNKNMPVVLSKSFDILERVRRV